MRLQMLQTLRLEYGDLNRALVIEYVLANGVRSERVLARELGLNRSVIRRCLRGWSESDQGS